MTEDGYTTMRVPEDDLAVARDAKRENETWGDYLRRCADEPAVTMSEVDVRRIVREEVDQLRGRP